MVVGGEDHGSGGRRQREWGGGRSSHVLTILVRGVTLLVFSTAICMHRSTYMHCAWTLQMLFLTFARRPASAHFI